LSILGLADAFFRETANPYAAGRASSRGQLDGSMRRVSGCDRQFQAFPVGGEFAVLALGIAEVVDGKRVERIRTDMFFLHFVGQTPGALVQIDVLDFVS
jgi:hypothetical protein